MSKSSITAIVIAIVLIIGISVWASMRNSTHNESENALTATSSGELSQQAAGGEETVPAATTTSSSTGTSQAAVSQPAASQTTQPSAAPVLHKFTVNASDESADLTQINVAKGDVVDITFNVDPANTYHGGLDFRSSFLNTGTIAPGASKTVQFTANSSFTLVPYWPASNIKKPYVVTVTVK